MIAAACVLLALALVCAPGAAGSERLRHRWPVARRQWKVQHTLSALPLVAAALLGLAVAGPGGAVAATAVAALVRSRRARRRAESLAAAAGAELASALSRITDELRAGAHPAEALAGARCDGPYAQAVLVPAAVAAGLGDGVPAALDRAATRRPELATDLGRVARVWALAERHGIPLADLLAGAHADLRWRLRFSGQVRALLAGPRATAAVLTALPLLGVALGQLVGADPLAVLRGSPIGQVLLVTGTALTAAGICWVDHILRGAAPR